MKKMLVLTVCLAVFGFLASAGVTTVSATSSKCDWVCENHGPLICGSDGVTYLNACHFDRAYCKDHSLTPMGYGASPAKSATSSSLGR